MRVQAYESYGVVLDDWLAIYTFRGGELDGHSSVRITELWPEWGPVGERDVTLVEERAAMSRVLARADREGPPPHGESDNGSAGWCSVCERDDY